MTYFPDSADCQFQTGSGTLRCLRQSNQPVQPMVLILWLESIQSHLDAPLVPRQTAKSAAKAESQAPESADSAVHTDQMHSQQLTRTN